MLRTDALNTVFYERLFNIFSPSLSKVVAVMELLRAFDSHAEVRMFEINLRISEIVLSLSSN